MDAASLLSNSALTLATRLQQGEVTAQALVDAVFQQLGAHDERLGAFLSHSPDRARATARRVDEQRKAGQSLPLLAGVPIAVKDNIAVTGAPTTCASRMLAQYRSPFDATVVRLLEAHGLPIVGKTNLDEFAMGSSTENSAFQPTRNPWDDGRVPGGSSGGSAVAVASGMVPLSLGSDTGGSVRQPAALCGIVGYKPTYGLVSRYGLVAFASSLDQISPFARTVGDVAALLDVIVAQDPNDSTSVAMPGSDRDATTAAATPNRFLEATRRPVERLRVGVIAELDGQGMQPAVQAAFADTLDRLAQQSGVTVETVSIAAIREAISAYYIIAPAEASSNLARFDGVRYGHRTERRVDNVYDMFRKTRAEGFGPEVKRRIMLGTFALSAGYYDAYYGKAQQARFLLAQSFAKAFESFDVLVCPTSPTTAFALGDKTDDPISMYLNDVATIPVNLAGLCAVSLPCGQDEAGLPIGLQLVAPRFADERLLQAAAFVETLLGRYANQLPPAYQPKVAAA